MVDPSQRDQELDIYGFRKVMVALTNFNKVIGFSSLDGSELWTSLFYHVQPSQIVLLKQHSRQDDTSSTQVVVCFEDHLEFLSSTTGELLAKKTWAKMVSASRFIVTNIDNSDNQNLVVVGKSKDN